MSENVENLILERLQQMDDRFANIGSDVRHIRLRMTAAEEHLVSIQTSILALNSRMDRFDERFGRVERRLDMKDAS